MKKKYVLFLFAFFVLCFVNAQDDDCIVDAGIELVPAPTDDPEFTGFSTYPSETTVQICYEVETYNTPSTQNWMHGIVPLFGPGWDLSTLQPVGQPESQGNFGEWIWTGDVVAGITGEVISSPGWWYDSTQGANGASLDGDPSNNWGDGNNGPWTFCWEISTQSCPPAFNEASLIIEILNFADSETGSWENSAALNQCIDDPSYYIQGLQLDCPTCDESSISIVNPTCETVNTTGGVAILTPSGIGPWNYMWFNLSTGEVIQENTNVNFPGVVTLTGLDAGDYLIQVEDLGFPGGCASGEGFQILPPESILAEFEIINANCYDLSDGSIIVSSIMNENCINDDVIDLDVSCPSTPNEVCGCDFVTYFNSCQAENWYGITAYELGECPENDSDYEISWSSSNNFSGSGSEISDLSIGEYNVLIECVDNTSPVFGCSFQSVLVVDSPDQFIYDYEVENVSCFVDDNNDGVNDITDGSITIALTGGTDEYTILLGEVNSNDVIEQNGSVVVFDNLPSGDYYFSPFDIFDCMVFEQEVYFSISDPDPLVIEDVVVSEYNGFEISCNEGGNGFINVDVSGGTGNYEFNWSNGSTDSNLNNVTAGIYSCTILDENNCQVDLIDIVLDEPTAISIIDFTMQPVSCSGASDGALGITVEGGVGDYSYFWSNGAQVEDLVNVSTGDYTITITDENNCEYQQTFNVATPNPILINESVTNISCFGENDGIINLNISGGNPPYEYLWSNGEISQDINNLEPGLYEVTVSDIQNCFSTNEFIIIEPDILSATATMFDVDCFGENTGSGVSFIQGGTEPYNENWSGGADPNNLFTGAYSMTITDVNGCIFVLSDLIVEEPNQELQLSATVTDASCNGSFDGSILPSASGGTPPYQYAVDGFFNINSLSAGDYTVSVEDANGCTAQDNFIVDEPSLILSNITTLDVSCFGLTDGQAIVNPSGGTGPYQYLWSNGSTASSVNNLVPGTYFINITDVLGCSYIETFVINEPSSSEMEILLTSNSNPSCLEDFSVSVVGTSSISGSWSASGEGSVSFSNPFSDNTDVSVSDYGLYQLIFTDDCGEQVILNIDMVTITPLATAEPSYLYCDFETTLEAYSVDNGSWSLISPSASELLDNNTEIEILDSNSLETDIIFSPINSDEECCYDEYLFSFSSCGSEDFVTVYIEKQAPEIGVSTHVACVLNGQVYINNEASNANILIDPGYWEPIGAGAENVTINYETPYEVDITVSDYGMYYLEYHICDTSYIQSIGFSCPLTLPNAFTPNGDFNNDVFLATQLIEGVHDNISFIVYNRWGSIVHSQSNYDFQGSLWDGTTNTFEDKELSDGVYFYTLELYNRASKRKESYDGYVHLFRGVE
tara:strand:- start:3828 stop:7907 length:4080 start_codon:yes stop_codon:yes gene_type:complete